MLALDDPPLDLPGTAELACTPRTLPSTPAAPVCCMGMAAAAAAAATDMASVVLPSTTSSFSSTSSSSSSVGGSTCRQCALGCARVLTCEKGARGVGPELSQSDAARQRLSTGARMMAALALAQNRWPRSKSLALAYRLTEFSANVLCLCCMLWVVWHWTVLVLFVALWYLPAACHTGSLWKPVRLPLLNFVVDDFSLLGMHPTLRPALKMHALCLFRVLILLVAIPYLIVSDHIPRRFRFMLSEENSLHVLFWGQLLHGRQIPDPSADAWIALTVAVLLLSGLWVLLASSMILAACARAGPLSWGRDKPLLREVDRLAAQVDQALGQADWRACLRQMQRLKAEHPGLKLTTVATTCGPAAGTLVHLLLDLSVAHTFFSHGWNYPASRLQDFILGALTTLNFLFTLVHNCHAAGGNPFAVVTEARQSFDRGAFTERYIRILYGDLGAHVLPTLGINVFGLPSRADHPIKVFGAIAAILVTVATCVPFIFQQFDLGAEREGFADQRLQSLEPAKQAPEPLDFPGEEVKSQTRCVLRRLV